MYGFMSPDQLPNGEPLQIRYWMEKNGYDTQLLLECGEFDEPAKFVGLEYVSVNLGSICQLSEFEPPPPEDVLLKEIAGRLGVRESFVGYYLGGSST